jgi:hypothetical protein
MIITIISRLICNVTHTVVSYAFVVIAVNGNGAGPASLPVPLVSDLNDANGVGGATALMTLICVLFVLLLR